MAPADMLGHREGRYHRTSFAMCRTDAIASPAEEIPSRKTNTLWKTMGVYNPRDVELFLEKGKQWELSNGDLLF